MLCVLASVSSDLQPVQTSTFPCLCPGKARPGAAGIHHVSFAHGLFIRRITPNYLHTSNGHDVILSLSRAAMPCLRQRFAVSCAARYRKAIYGARPKTDNRPGLVSALPQTRLTCRQRPANVSTAYQPVLCDGLRSVRGGGESWGCRASESPQGRGGIVA